jgi:hypothetical protein
MPIFLSVPSFNFNSKLNVICTHIEVGEVEVDFNASIGNMYDAFTKERTIVYIYFFNILRQL